MVARCRTFVAAALVAAALLVRPAPAAAQVTSTESTAVLTALMLETLTVVLTPPAVTFTLSGGSATNPGTLPVLMTTAWTFAGSRTSLTAYAYFSDATAALSHTLPTNTVNIPSSRVGVSVNGGTLMSFNQTVPFGAANAGATLFSQAVGVLTLVGTRIDTLTFNIDTSSFSLPADTYIGTLRIRVQSSQ